MTQKHTPLPWKISSQEKQIVQAPAHFTIGICGGTSDSSRQLKDFNFTPDSEEREANTEFITRACNSHYELIAILEDYCRAFETNGNHDTYARAMVALKKAKGE